MRNSYRQRGFIFALNKTVFVPFHVHHCECLSRKDNEVMVLNNYR